MKRILKYLAQILSAIIYTPIYAGLIYIIIVIPAMWLVTLSFGKMLCLVLLFSGLYEGCLSVLKVLGILPYAWILRENKIALGISISLCLLVTLYNGYILWKVLLGYGGGGIALGIILSLFLLQFLILSELGYIGIYKDNKIAS